MKQMTELQKAKSRRTLKRGTFTLLTSLLLIAVLVGVNVGISALPSSLTKFDTSTVGFYKISDETREILASVDVPVTMYLIATQGQEDQTILELLNRYADLSGKISVKTVDPTVNPGFTATYTEEELSQNSVIAVSERRHFAVDYNSIYVVSYENITEEDYYNYLYYGITPTGTPYFYGETMLTTAVDYVASPTIPTVYTLSSHNEDALSDTMQSNFTTGNIVLKDLDLLSAGTVPEDCSAILLNNPKSDISAYEAELLLAYAENGGDFLLVTDFRYYSAETMPNLASLTARMGMKEESGLLIETDRSFYNSHPSILLPKMGSGGPVENLTSQSTPTMMPNSHGILLTGEGEAMAAPLLTSSETAFVKKNITDNSTYEKEEGDTEGQFHMAAYASLGESQLVWFASPYILSDSMDYYVNGGNSLLFMASVNWMCDKTVSVSVLAKTMQVEALVIPTAAQGVWALVLTVLLPVGTLGCGFAVWFRRRHK